MTNPSVTTATTAGETLTPSIQSPSMVAEDFTSLGGDYSEVQVGPPIRRSSDPPLVSSCGDEALSFDSTRLPRHEDRSSAASESVATGSGFRSHAEISGRTRLSVTSESRGFTSKETSYFPSISDERSTASTQSSIKPNQGSVPSRAPTSKSDDDETAYSWEFTIASNQANVFPGTPRGSLSRKSLSQSKYQRRQSRSLSLSRRLSDLTVNKLHFEELGILYGRDRECQMLREAWEEVLLARTLSGASAANERRHDEGSVGKSGRRLVTISGLSGTGKSALAESLQDTVRREGGFFLQGKFPQQHRLSRHSVEPYVAFAAACGELCELVVSLYAPTDGLVEIEEASYNSRKYLKFTLDQFREKLNREIGADSLVLTRVVPGLLQILKVASSADGGYSDSIGMLEAHHQFKFAFRRFIRAVTSFGPIVLTLDDLQWADAASMELLEALISDRENNSFLVIGMYRSDEVFLNQPHIKAIDNIKEMSTNDGNLKVDSISIGTLGIEQVNHLLVDLLSSSEDQTRVLAECVHKKTFGNVFFVIQFVTMLQELDLLEYNFGALKWTWDVQKIQASTVATENVVSLMKDKMKRLPVSIGKALPVMACLGSSFSLAVFALLVDHILPLWQVELDDCIREEDSGDPGQVYPVSHSQALDLLTLCEEEGLIEVGDEDHTYRWVHDKIQEAAYGLITEDELQVLKLELGKILYERLDQVGLERNLFVVADLLNVESLGESSLPYQQPVEVAKLYLRAGVKTIESSAHEQATGYLMHGIGLLPADHWQTFYDLSLELYSTAAEAEFCIGNFDKVREYCDEIIRQDDRPLLDKKRAYMVILESTAAENRLSDALALSQTILSKLGCKFPKRGVAFHVVGGIIRAKSTLKKQTPARISRLPPMYDERQLWVMLVLDKFVTYSYMVKSDLLPLAIFKGLRMTLVDGVSDYSPVMFALVGFTLAAFLGDYNGGEGYASHGIEILKQVRSARKVEARVIFVSHALVLHCSHPITLLTKPLLAGYEVGMQMGDTESAAWCIYFYLEFAFRTGTSLEVLLADCSFYAEQLREVKQLKILAILLNLWQVILFLMGENEFSGRLTGSIVDEEKVLREADQDFEHLFAGLYRMQMYVAFLLGEYEMVFESLVKTDMANGYYEKIFPGTLGLYHLNAFNGLSMVSLYRKTKQKKYLKLAKKMAATIKVWALAGNPNVAQYDALLDAEFNSIRGDICKAARYFEVAVLYTGRRGLTQDQALAHERFGEHFARLGPGYVQDAEFHLSEALKLYEEWGAQAKVKQLQNSYESLLGPEIRLDIQSCILVVEGGLGAPP